MIIKEEKQITKYSSIRLSKEEFEVVEKLDEIASNIAVANNEDYPTVLNRLFEVMLLHGNDETIHLDIMYENC